MRAVLVGEKTTISPFSEKNPHCQDNLYWADLDSKFSALTLLFASSSLLSFALIMQSLNSVWFASLSGLSLYLLGFHFKMKSLSASKKIITLKTPLEAGDCILQIGHYGNYLYYIEKVGFQHYYLINTITKEKKLSPLKRLIKTIIICFPLPSSKPDSKRLI